MIESLGFWTGLLAIVVLVSFVAERVRMPSPLLLVLIGVALSLVPNAPSVSLHPELVLQVVLPLLIYTSAVAIPWREFRANLRPILFLSIGLVIFTTFTVGWLAQFMVPEMAFATALVLGAVISPTDDVAAAAVVRKLPIPHRILHILEGESLLNDATALTLFPFALMGVISGSLSAWQVPTLLTATIIGGTAYGLLIGWISLKIRQKLRDTSLEITVSLITPFAAYLLPEHFGVTGIPAVAAAGLLVSAQSASRIPAATRLQVHALWRLVSFWLNGLLFLLLGLQLKGLLDALAGDALVDAIQLGLMFSLLVILLRFAWMFSVPYVTRLLLPAWYVHEPVPPRRQLFLLGYTGMRGAISMAAALAIPLTLPSGEAFPQRELIVFITYCVILVTLVGQGLLLPVLIKPLGIRADWIHERESEGRMILNARAELVRAGIAHLDALQRSGMPATLIEPLRQARYHYLKQLGHHLGGHADERLERVAVQDLEIHHEVLAAERQALLKMRHEGRISDSVLMQAERDLDLQEARLQEHALPFGEPEKGEGMP